MRTLTGFLLALDAFAQAAQFEVTSVRSYAPDQIGMSTITAGPSRLKAESVTIQQLIGYTYDVSPLVITGHAPAARFDIEGKAEGVHSRAELRLMLQDLLANRFNLRLHHETGMLTVDVLVVGKSPKLQVSEMTEPDPCGFQLHSFKLPGHVAVEGQAISMLGLANYLPLTTATALSWMPPGLKASTISQSIMKSTPKR
jgi:uncharacterized protein (TIGR03435 family)